jgi:hypothetical protein
MHFPNYLPLTGKSADFMKRHFLVMGLRKRSTQGNQYRSLASNYEQPALLNIFLQVLMANSLPYFIIETN